MARSPSPKKSQYDLTVSKGHVREAIEQYLQRLSLIADDQTVVSVDEMKTCYVITIEKEDLF